MEDIISLSQGIDPALRSVVFAIACGVGMIIVARRLKISSIATLLIAGVVLGPEFLGLMQPEALEGGLETIVAPGVAVILFEGGLSLDINGYRQAIDGTNQDTECKGPGVPGVSKFGTRFSADCKIDEQLI